MCAGQILLFTRVFFILFSYLLQLGCHLVAVVILHVNKTWNWLLLDLSREGYMSSMLWQLGLVANICRNDGSCTIHTDFLFRFSLIYNAL